MSKRTIEFFWDPASPYTDLAATQATAVMRGVFGAPAFWVGNEMFRDKDRLQFVRAFLKGTLVI